MERAGLQCGHAFAHELGAAVDEARVLGTVLEGLARNGLVVLFVGLAEVGGVGVGVCAVNFHPVQGGRGVKTAGERDADLLADGKMFKNDGHEW